MTAPSASNSSIRATNTATGPSRRRRWRRFERLAADIVRRHRIPPQRVVGHSDVAPARKRDPGELFDWPRLARAGVGLWPALRGPVNVAPVLRAGSRGRRRIRHAIRPLAAWGYGLRATGEYDDATVEVAAAFQRHFRPPPHRRRMGWGVRRAPARAACRPRQPFDPPTRPRRTGLRDRLTIRLEGQFRHDRFPGVASDGGAILRLGRRRQFYSLAPRILFV